MQIKWALFLFIALFLRLSDVYGQDCAEIRLDLSQRSLALVPTTDQGNTNLCYAYAAAQLVDAYRASQGSFSVAIEPEHLVQETIIEHPDRDTIYGGWVQDALQTAGAGRVYPSPQVATRFEDKLSSFDLRDTAQKILSAGRPLAVNFCAEVVTLPSFTPAYGGFGSCARHYAVIVGQRKSAVGRCEVLVRDSLCSQYPEDKKKGPRCQQGQFWIEINALMSNSDGLVWL